MINSFKNPAIMRILRTTERHGAGWREQNFIPDNEFGTAFVYYFLKENKQLLESHSSGTTFMEISGSVLKTIPAYIPPKNLTKRFSSICEPIFTYQAQIEAEIHQLLELRRMVSSQLSSR